MLKVPTSSLFRHESAWAVYVVENGVAHRRLVEVGQRSGLEAEILKGVTAGERIIVYPSDAIRDGVKVAPRSSDRSGKREAGSGKLDSSNARP